MEEPEKRQCEGFIRDLLLMKHEKNLGYVERHVLDEIIEYFRAEMRK